MKTQKLLKTFKAARRVSTPIVAVSTPDPAATMKTMADSVNGVPVIAWNSASGLVGINQQGTAEVDHIHSNADANKFRNLLLVLTTVAMELPAKSVLFVQNSQRFISNEIVAQATWNLRDQFKKNFRTLVLLSPSTNNLPAELTKDVIPLSEELPDAEELTAIIHKLFKAAEFPEISGETLSKAVEAVNGLSAFEAEQVVAMSLIPETRNIDLDGLWERKRNQIEQTPGLSVHRGNERLEDVRDCDNLVKFLKLYMPKVSAVVFIDEIEKVMAGTQGDTSGTSQEMHGTLLRYMADNNIKGILLLGHPGTGKSMVAKGSGGSYGKPVIKFDMSAMKGSLVGEANARLNSCLKMVNAVGQDHTVFIATCNQYDALSPELRSRFKLGTFFLDLPSAIGRSQLWKQYIKKHDLKEKGCGFNDEGWTGREIETCCELSATLSIKLKEAADYIVPLVRSAANEIKELREKAHAKFISASHSGTYKREGIRDPGEGRAISAD